MSNEAAERVRERLGVFYRDPMEAILFDAASRDLDAALSEERRAAVERIRAALAEESPVPLQQALRNQASGPEWDDLFWRADLLAILDAEAQRS